MSAIKTRMRFTKTGSIRFIGHLDLMRFFQKAIRRAGLDVAYSKGYSPHQLMSFAAPLGVGATTDGDYIDIEFASLDLEMNEVMDRLNSCLTDEVFITECERMPQDFKNSMSMLTKADYMVTAKEESDLPSDYKGSFESFLSRPEIIVTKKTKKSEKQIDLKSEIHAYAYDLSTFEKNTGQKYGELHTVYEGESIFLSLTTGSSVNIKPEQVMDAYFEYVGFDPREWGLQIHRMQMYFM